MWNFIYLGFFVISFLFSLGFIPLFRKIAFRFGIVDIPSDRKIHKKPTPLLGGLGIFFSFFLSILLGLILVRSNFLFGFLKDYIPGIYSVLPKLLSLLSGGAIVIIYGILDDIYIFKALSKLLLQILSSTIIFISGIRITFFIPNAFVSYIITIFWLILMMNSFNLLDNMDGLSAGVAFITGFILFVFAFEMEQLFIATILSVFLGSILGFLFYNFPPAKIFMGECGSSFIGYFLGTVSILLTYYKYEGGKNFLPVFIPLIVFSVPFFDTISVMWIRKKKGYSIFTADKNHLSHRLVAFGMTQKQAVLFIYLLTLTTGINALILKNLNIFGGIEIIIEVILILTLIAILEFVGRSNDGKNNTCS